MILVIDNYDSFTWNLVQYLAELGAHPRVLRNDAIDAAGLLALAPERLIISPGPGSPDDAGISCEAIRRLAGRVPILGVCLGHQCIGQVFGGRIVRAARLMHGKTSWIHHRGEGILAGLPEPFEATRYHSLLIERSSLPSCLRITGETDEGEIMAVQHVEWPVYGVQFHPESILTKDGKRILKNFLEIPVRTTSSGG
ncbi:MAG: aminodeoxychorismate/anthranilate synthase component II [Kiritimatiellae bacterium]|nr:aminodeoxychorismate/anthranilate synthase component II [Kiritimatiellia bacterium]